MIGLDFFCGAGGLTRGLLNVDIDVILGIDMDASHKETYEYNNQPARFLAADIRHLDVNDVLDITGLLNPDDLLIAACAPCQPFTQLRQNSERGSDATLLGQLGRFIHALQPKYVIVENVPGLAKVKGASTYRRFKKLLVSLGYQIIDGVLNAKNYGVPQNRQRLILIAIKGTNVSLPPFTHGNGKGLFPFETVRNAIESYPPIKAGEKHPTIPNHQAAILFPINLDRIQHTPHDGGGRTSWPEHLWLKCHKNGRGGHTDVYGRMCWDLPAPTLTCRCNSLSNGRYGHPEQDRAISLREAAKLQTFHDTYIFYGPSQKALSAQIGNAVPVTMAEAIGSHVLELSQMTDI